MQCGDRGGLSGRPSLTVRSPIVHGPACIASPEAEEIVEATDAVGSDSPVSFYDVSCLDRMETDEKDRQCRSCCPFVARTRRSTGGPLRIPDIDRTKSTIRPRNGTASLACAGRSGISATLARRPRRRQQPPPRGGATPSPAANRSQTRTRHPRVRGRAVAQPGSNVRAKLLANITDDDRHEHLGQDSFKRCPSHPLNHAHPDIAPLHQEPARARAGSQSQETPLTGIGA